MKLIAGGFLTWARKSRKAVQSHIQNNDEEGITAIGAIDYASRKFPLIGLRKGKTPCCLTKLALPGDVWSHFTGSGWTAIAILRLYSEGELVVTLDT
jgi:hypothetical protein